MFDLTGQRFGKWTVLSKSEDRMWLCQCECGTVRKVNGDNLRHGLTQSCGCYRDDRSRSRFRDLTGQRFGSWTVIKKTNKRASGGVVWLCKCDCGTIREVYGSNLVSGKTKSCGCCGKKGVKK